MQCKSLRPLLRQLLRLLKPQVEVLAEVNRLEEGIPEATEVSMVMTIEGRKDGDDPRNRMVKDGGDIPTTRRTPWIPLLDCMQDTRYVYLVLPYLAGGDLFDKVQAAGEGGLPQGQARTYLRHVAQGLLYMKRTARLAHHDVSLEVRACVSDDADGGGY